ncbi:MAG: (2Fe-2S)-binding protein [Nitrosomonadales bacterium]|jgi:NAD(P)H-nitrite reductase large subunit
MSTKNTDAADPIMCHCSGTRRGNIQSLFEQGMDINAISRWTGALSGCGGCEWDIAQFLQELAARSSSQSFCNSLTE